MIGPNYHHDPVTLRDFPENEVQQVLQDRAEHEVKTLDPAFRAYLTEVCDASDNATALATIIASLGWRGESGVVDARDICEDIERSYVQYRTETATESERNLIAEML